VTERLLALAVVTASGIYLLSALGLPLGTIARPGAGFFPMWIGLFGAVFAMVWTVMTLRRTSAAARVLTIGTDARGRVVATAAALVGFCFVLPWVGYPVAALGFVAAALRWLGASWRASLLIALGSAIASYYLFAVLLSVPLPPGLLFD
jgi:putative tricarboxylic transport membrane protein